VGTFQYFAARGDTEALRLLADHVVGRHYPASAEEERPYRALLEAVVAAQADLVSRWLLVGFIHGVMNTDNMSISGETIDYGPCAFMDAYDPATVFSSIDRMGRYAYGKQPSIALWNLTRLAEAMLPLLADDEDAAIGQAQEALTTFRPLFEGAYHSGLGRKLGLNVQGSDDVELIEQILKLLTASQVDFTLFFRRLSDAAAGQEEPVRSLFVEDAALDAWLARWRARLAQEGQPPEARRSNMDAVNPAFIPRNHRVEAMIKAAVDHEDYGPFEEMLEVLSRPYQDQPAFAQYSDPPLPHERVTTTFCGT
jgi:uncharacterized protein YdiU (UPF0061 family)